MTLAYCDGSCPQQHGVGGWAYVILLDNGEFVEESGWDHPATNNTMELAAALQALRRIRKLDLYGKPLVLISDSQYVIKGLMTWRRGWQMKGFDGVKNLDFWKRLYRHQDRCANFDARWVKGHNGNYWNEYVDKMAGAAQRSGVIQRARGVVQP